MRSANTNFASIGFTIIGNRHKIVIMATTNKTVEDSKIAAADGGESKVLLGALIIFMIIGLMVGLGACSSGARETALLSPTIEGIDLSFETIEQLEWSPEGRYFESGGPGVIIASETDDISDLIGLVSADCIDKLEKLNFDKSFVIGVFHGWRPSTGYGIQIDRLIRSENSVNIFITLHEPKPNEPTGAMETSPYHVVKLQKTGSWGQNIIFNLIADNLTVASVTHMIP